MGTKNEDKKEQRRESTEEKSVKVTSPKEQDIIEDNFESKLETPNLAEPEIETKKDEPVDEEVKAEEEEVLPRRRGRSQVTSPLVTPLKKRDRKEKPKSKETIENIDKHNKNDKNDKSDKDDRDSP